MKLFISLNKHERLNIFARNSGKRNIAELRKHVSEKTCAGGVMCWWRNINLCPARGIVYKTPKKKKYWSVGELGSGGDLTLLRPKCYWCLVGCVTPKRGAYPGDKTPPFFLLDDWNRHLAALLFLFLLDGNAIEVFKELELSFSW